MDIILGTLQDAFFAAIASVGFASISNPPHRIYPVCAGIAAVGHSLRYVLMNAADMHLVIASDDSGNVCLQDFPESHTLSYRR